MLLGRKERIMKEYIFARPNEAEDTAKRDAYYRGELIRCKDCIHSTSQVSDDEDNYYCNAMRRCMHSLDFCSYGERKE